MKNRNKEIPLIIEYDRVDNKVSRDVDKLVKQHGEILSTQYIADLLSSKGFSVKIGKLKNNSNN